MAAGDPEIPLGSSKGIGALEGLRNHSVWGSHAPGMILAVDVTRTLQKAHG